MTHEFEALRGGKRVEGEGRNGGGTGPVPNIQLVAYE